MRVFVVSSGPYDPTAESPMKSLLLVSIPVLAIVSACRSAPDAAPGSAARPTSSAPAQDALDFSPYRNETLTAEGFLKVCQGVSGWNFTYTESTRAALSAQSVSLADTDRIPAAEFERFLAAHLDACGFMCERVGPEHLRVILVKPRAA